MNQLATLKTRLDIPLADKSKDALLESLLDASKHAILAKRYPFGYTDEELERMYLHLQVELAIIYYNKLGVEGQTSHSENGISRAYQTEESVLRSVVSKVKTL